MSALAASKPNSPPPITAALRHPEARARIASMSSIVPRNGPKERPDLTFSMVFALFPMRFAIIPCLLDRRPREGAR